MPTRSRVALLVGGIASASCLAYLKTHPNRYADGTVGVHLIEAILDCIFVGSTAFVGAFLGLRSIPSDKLSYLKGLEISGGYLVLMLLINLIPIGKVAIRSDELVKPLLGAVAALVLLIAIPYVAALLVGSRFNRGA